MQQEAKQWRLRHEAVSVSAPSAAASSLKKLPAKLDLQTVRPLQPQVPGVTIWHEMQTGRIRASYIADNKKVTKSAVVEQMGLSKAIEYCLKWQWEQHTA
eukprot:7538858-Lingulodinium_polyedra.AAC.1